MKLQLPGTTVAVRAVSVPITLHECSRAHHIAPHTARKPTATTIRHLEMRSHTATPAFRFRHNKKAEPKLRFSFRYVIY